MSSIRKVGKNYMIGFYWNGKKFQRSLKVPTVKLAEIMQRRYDEVLAGGTFPDEAFLSKSQNKTLKELTSEFTDYLDKREKQYSKKTIKSYEYNTKILKEILGEIELKRISRSVVEKDIIPYLYENYSKSTVRHFITHFRAIFSKAVDWGYIDRNPFSKMVPKPDKKKPRYFSQKEIEQIEKYFRKKETPAWQFDLTFLGLNTGLRKFELYNLSWKQVDLRKQQLIISGKGNKERIVPLNDKALKILNKRFKRKVKAFRVFPEVTNLDSIGTAWQRMRTRTKLDIRFHDIRSTYASYYVMNGGSIMRLKEILGHEDLQTTMIYATLSPENLHREKNIVAF